MTGPSNNGMQLTKAARCAPFAFRSWGQSLRAAFAADPGCSLESEEAGFEYRLEHHPEFLARIQSARTAIRRGEGVRLEDIPA